MSFIEIKNVSFGYGHKTPFEVQALSNVSLSVEKGEFISVIGHTGSGKSTLMQMLNGLIKPEAGEIRLDGKNINANKKNISEARFRVGLCFQYPEYLLRHGEAVINPGPDIYAVVAGGAFPAIGKEVVVYLAVITVHRLEPTKELVGGD